MRPDPVHSRRARESARAQHARRQSVVSQMELDIAEENLARAARNREALAVEVPRQRVCALALC